MSTEKKPKLPNTDEVALLAGEQRGVEHLSGTILLERYRLLELLGSGGAAVVYRAEHTMMQKPVAVKILRRKIPARQDFVQRFLAEARTVARLRHEHIVDIVDVGRTETGLVFCVMEYLEGEDLGVTMERDGPMTWKRTRDIVMQVCQALGAAHAAGVVHRDVKPQNCLRVRRGSNPDFIKLLDFGIAKQTDNDQGLTATGVIMGTAEYMAPEQARGKLVDARTDIYSVGAMLFEMLAGRPPFIGDSFLDVLMKHASEPAPRLTTLVPSLHPTVDTVMAKLLAKNPQDRYASVEQVMTALDACDDRTFRGSFDLNISGPTARPESVLAPSASYQVIGALGRLDRGTLLAICLAVVLGVVGIYFVVQHMKEADTLVAAGQPDEVPPKPEPEPEPPQDEPPQDEPPKPESTKAEQAQAEPPKPEPPKPEPPKPEPPKPEPPQAEPPKSGTDKSEKAPEKTIPKKASSKGGMVNAKKQARTMETLINDICEIATIRTVEVSIASSRVTVTSKLTSKTLKKCIVDTLSARNFSPGTFSLHLKPT